MGDGPEALHGWLHRRVSHTVCFYLIFLLTPKKLVWLIHSACCRRCVTGNEINIGVLFEKWFYLVNSKLPSVRFFFFISITRNRRRRIDSLWINGAMSCGDVRRRATRRRMIYTWAATYTRQIWRCSCYSTTAAIRNTTRFPIKGKKGQEVDRFRPTYWAVVVISCNQVSMPDLVACSREVIEAVRQRLCVLRFLYFSDCAHLFYFHGVTLFSRIDSKRLPAVTSNWSRRENEMIGDPGHHIYIYTIQRHQKTTTKFPFRSVAVRAHDGRRSHAVMIASISVYMYISIPAK